MKKKSYTGQLFLNQDPEDKTLVGEHKTGPLVRFVEIRSWLY